MRCLVIETFNRRGEPQHPGSIIEVPDEALAKLTGYVRPVATADSYKFKAWLTDTGELRTTGVCDDLAGEIVKLTADNLPLQKKLLRDHVGKYSGPQWMHTIRRWRERAKHLFEDEGRGLHEANQQAAAEMHLLAFADELNLTQPETGNKGDQHNG